MRSFFIGLLFLLCFFAAYQKVYAHASPVESSILPDSVVASTPGSLSINFTERVDPELSNIRVTGPNGELVSGQIIVQDSSPRRIEVPILSGGFGTYNVEYYILSLDDGHYLNGSFPFIVGGVAQASLPPNPISNVNPPFSLYESVTTALEVLGQAVLVGAAVLVIIFLMTGASGFQIFSTKRFRLLLFFSLIVYLVGVIGNYSYSYYLQSSISGDFWQYLTSLVENKGGVRIGLGILSSIVLFSLLMFFLPSRKSGRHFIYSFIILMSCLTLMFSRTYVSHASASEFYPTLSVAINTFHLFAKDTLVGLILILAFFIRSFNKRDVLAVFKVLPLFLFLGGVSGCYIVFLHLKDFGNILVTNWGILFSLLNVVAFFFATAILTIYFLLYKDSPIEKLIWPVRIGAFFGVFVIIISGFLIVTNPPGVPKKIVIEEKEIGGVSASMYKYITSPDVYFLISPGDEVVGMFVRSNSDFLQKYSDGTYAYPLPDQIVGNWDFFIDIEDSETGKKETVDFLYDPQMYMRPWHTFWGRFEWSLVASAIGITVVSLLLYLLIRKK